MNELTYTVRVVDFTKILYALNIDVGSNEWEEAYAALDSVSYGDALYTMVFPSTAWKAIEEALDVVGYHPQDIEDMQVKFDTIVGDAVVNLEEPGGPGHHTRDVGKPQMRQPRRGGHVEGARGLGPQHG
jgi:hypothetical protein